MGNANINWDKVISLYKNGYSANRLGIMYNCKCDTVIHNLSKRGIRIRGRNEQRLLTYGIKPVEEWKRLYKQGLSLYKIADQYETSYDIVRDALRKTDIVFRVGNTRYDLPWDKVIYMYVHQKESMTRIAKIYGCDLVVIKDGLKRYSIKIRDNQEQCLIDRLSGKRPYNELNERFFDKWNREMAYVLGWIYSDGNIHKKLNQFNICTESEHLVKLANILDSNAKITYCTDFASKLTISRKSVVKKLLEYGLTPNKTKTINFPDVPCEYLGDFVRGYFEGDGCVTVGKDTKWRKVPRISVSFVSSSKVFLDELKKRLGLNGGGVYLNKNTSVYFLMYSGFLDVFKLYYFMYDNTNSNMCLERKVKKFNEYFSSQNVVNYMKERW